MPMSTITVAKVLGLSSTDLVSKYDLSIRLAEGLPVASLDRLCDAIAPDDKALRSALIARATLARRRHQQTLSPEESERVERVARVWAMANNVYKDEQAARRFLTERHGLLHGRKPIEVAIANDIGAEVVEDILGRLKYGSAA